MIRGAFVVGVCLIVVNAAVGADAHVSRADVRRANALVYSRASNAAVQPQPAPGSCHTIGSGLYTRPDPRCTPGALDPAVTQANIAQTICKPGWTETVRPPEEITEHEKRLSMAAYDAHHPIEDYEYDHFVPLELGGATNDPRNLWPEFGASPNPKDTVEDDLNREVCEGRMTLSHAQSAIVAGWVAIYQQLHRAASPTPSTPAPAPKPPARSATCTASAQWSNDYNDYDIYVNSNQPDTTVTVTGSGTSATWHTNGSGYADVYFHAARSASGAQVTVTVGAANCYATL